MSKSKALTGLSLAAVAAIAHNAQASEANSLTAPGGEHPLWSALDGGARVDPMARAESILTSDLTQETLQPKLQQIAAESTVTTGNGAFQSVCISLRDAYEPDTSGASITDLAAASVTT